MSDLISREEVLRAIITAGEVEPDLGYTHLHKVIENLPSADAVKVVRCKDCKHKVVTEDGEYDPEDIVCEYWMSDGLNSNDYCSYGERKE